MKYTRFIVGIIILFSFSLFMGTTNSEHASEACFDFCDMELTNDWGYIEVWNDTIFHIGVIIMYSKDSAQTFEIKHDPGMIRKAFIFGPAAVLTYIIDPITRKWKYHSTYRVNVAAGQTVVIRVSGGSIL